MPSGSFKFIIKIISAKDYSKDERGQSETSVHLQSLKQKMLSSKECLAFFHNIKMKQYIPNFFLSQYW